jgi:HSP20 family protein
MAAGNWEPLKDFANIQEKINKIFNEALSQSRLGLTKTGTGWTPATDLVERKDCFALEMEVPGIKTENLEIQCEGNSLTISGRRPLEENLKEENYSMLESSRGAFKRNFLLPENANEEGIEAELSNGLLRLKIPKAGNKTTHKISIKIK